MINLSLSGLPTHTMTDIKAILSIVLWISNPFDDYKQVCFWKEEAQYDDANYYGIDFVFILLDACFFNALGIPVSVESDWSHC